MLGGKRIAEHYADYCRACALSGDEPVTPEDFNVAGWLDSYEHKQLFRGLVDPKLKATRWAKNPSVPGCTCDQEHRCVVHLIEDRLKTHGVTQPNPKDVVGATKAPLDYFPMVAVLQGSRAMKNGADKYGRTNWRDFAIKRTIYIGAALRHLAADLDGETIDPETITPENPEGTPHLAMALAGIAIALDADAIGNLIDDRPKAGGYADLARKLYPPKK